MVLSSMSELLVVQKIETFKTAKIAKKHEIAGVKKPQYDTIKKHCKSEETHNYYRKIA